jgi:transcriptional regulator with XRE-family HTH domain
MLREMTQTIAKLRGSRSRQNRLLIEARLNAGLTPNDLAYRAGVSGNTVRSAERGQYIGPRAQYAITQALGVRPLDLFPFERQREAVR